MENIPPTSEPISNAPASPMVREKPATIFGSLQTFLAVSVALATLFTMWNPANLFSNQLLNQAFQTFTNYSTAAPAGATSVGPTYVRIGIVAGHYSEDPNTYDPGAVCPDGLTEESVNYNIAYLVYQKLTALGYQVDLLQEWDDRLMGYQATALVSIHNDSCEYINQDATGFKVASAIASASPENDARLTACLIDRYSARTGMQFHYNTITPDMEMYHNFYTINSLTPAAIIEAGFLNLDRTILTQNTDVVAQGITDGIMCYIRNESVQSATPTP